MLTVIERTPHGREGVAGYWLIRAGQFGRAAFRKSPSFEDDGVEILRRRIVLQATSGPRRIAESNEDRAGCEAGVRTDGHKSPEPSRESPSSAAAMRTLHTEENMRAPAR